MRNHAEKKATTVFDQLFPSPFQKVALLLCRRRPTSVVHFLLLLLESCPNAFPLLAVAVRIIFFVPHT